MGIFGGGYMKEGPGVSKSDVQKKGFFLYWDIVFRKFTKFMALNAMYMISSILFLVLAYVLLSEFVINAFGINESIESLASSYSGTDVSPEDVSQMLYMAMRSMITILLFNFMGAGPVSASYAYIARCYTKGQHAWLFSDGWDKFKENFKYSILVAIIDIIVIFLGMNAVAFYRVMAAETTGTMSGLFSGITAFTVMLISMYVVMHTYLYQIMVTYECKFSELWKSAVVMTMAKLPINILLSVIGGGLIVLMFSFMPNPVIGIIIYWFIGITFMKYPLDFYAVRVIDKNIKAVKKKQKKREAKITYID